MTAFTENWLLPEPVPLDASTDNNWGVTENTGLTMIDNGIAGIGTIQTTGGTVILTSNQGAPDQSRQRYFVVSGTLTSSCTILMPAGLSLFFSVNNQSIGGFTVSFGVNNGSGGAAGKVVAAPSNFVVRLASDGTNVFINGASGMRLQQTVFASTAVGGNFPNPGLLQYFFANITPKIPGSTMVVEAALGYTSCLANGPSGLTSRMTAELTFGSNTLKATLANASGGFGAGSNTTNANVFHQGVLTMVGQTVNAFGSAALSANILCQNGNSVGGALNEATTATILIQEWF